MGGLGRTENEDEERDQRLVQKVSENDADLNPCSGIRNGGKAEKCFQVDKSNGKPRLWVWRHSLGIPLAFR